MITPRLSLERSYNFGIGFFFNYGRNMFGSKLVNITIQLLFWEASIGFEWSNRF